MKLYLKNEVKELSEPAVMGILNVTPDSFSDGGNFLNRDDALFQVEKMIKSGADIIDVGGESTRPGAKIVEINNELDRVIPVIEKIKNEFDTIVSVDTYKERVAEIAVTEGGADIVNDISALSFSSGMAEIISRLDVPVILMHIKGTPVDMQRDPHYGDVVKEVTEYFERRVDFAESNGIKRNKIIIDPGIGFGKRVEDNVNILKNLKSFKKLGLPVLIGLSRKSFLGAISGETDPLERESETITANLISVMNGASVIRVHNVKNCVNSIKVLKQLV